MEREQMSHDMFASWEDKDHEAKRTEHEAEMSAR